MGSGIGKRCTSSFAFADAAAQLLVEDSLVEGVLVDDQYSLGGFEDDVGVVNLQRRTGVEHRGIGRCRRLHAWGWNRWYCL